MIPFKLPGFQDSEPFVEGLSEGIAAAPVIAAAVFPEFVARCTAAAVPGLAEGRARKPQPEAQRRDRVRTRAQRCPAPAMAKAKSPGKAMNSGKTGNTAATAQGPQNPPRGERPSAAGRCLERSDVAAICNGRSARPNSRADTPARWQHTAGRSPIRPFRVRETAGVESPDGDSYRADCGSDSAHARDDEVGPITRDLAGLGLQLLALGLDAGYLGNQLLQLKSFAG